MCCISTGLIGTMNKTKDQAMLKQSTEMCRISTGPAGVTPPVLTVLNSTSIEVTWSEPLQTNGIIEYYLLEWADARREIRNFTQLRVVLDNLVPYTEYSITLAACTSKLQGAEVLFSVRGRTLCLRNKRPCMCFYSQSSGAV